MVKFPDFSDITHLDLQQDYDKGIIETLLGTDFNHNIDPEGILGADRDCSNNVELPVVTRSLDELFDSNAKKDASPVEKEMKSSDTVKLVKTLEADSSTNETLKPVIPYTTNVASLHNLLEGEDANSGSCLTVSKPVSNMELISSPKNSEMVNDALFQGDERLKANNYSLEVSSCHTSKVNDPVASNCQMSNFKQPSVKMASTDTSDRPQLFLPPQSELKTETIETVNVSTQAVHTTDNEQCSAFSNASSCEGSASQKKDATKTTSSEQNKDDTFGLEWKDGIATLPGMNWKFFCFTFWSTCYIAIKIWVVRNTTKFETITQYPLCNC